MKNTSLLCCICMLLIFSCKKDNKADDTHDAKLYPINFNVSGFSQTDIPISGVSKAKTTALTTQATDTIPVEKLYYLLYTADASHRLLNSKTSKKGDANFGSVTDNVPAGNYMVTFGGGSSALILRNFYTEYFFSYFTGFINDPHPEYKWDDTFLKSIPITVTSAGVSTNVSLDRATSRLDLVIKDAIPAGTTKILVTFVDTFDLGSGGSTVKQGTSVNTQVVSAADIGKTNYTITMYTLNNVKPFNVNISYYGSNPNGPLGTKTVKNVVCKTNTKTILSGFLFTPGNAEFTIMVNQDWNTNTIQF
ncbi:MAG: hypothetical protein JWR38_5315 [Mucilaginibacter sp.]|nr:hypothetical protein [Mucilaginibacter sp.]